MIKVLAGVGQVWPGQDWVRPGGWSWRSHLCRELLSCCRLAGLVLLSQWRTGECDPSQHGLPRSLVRPLQGVCHEGESNPCISYNSTQLSRSRQPLAQANGLILLEIIGNINVVDLNRIVDCYFKFQGYWNISYYENFLIYSAVLRNNVCETMQAGMLI